MQWSFNSWRTQVYQNPRLFKPLFAVGLTTVLYGIVRLIYKGYRLYKDQLTLQRFLTEFIKKNNKEKEWIVLVSLETVNESFMEMISMVAKFCNIILIWDNRYVPDSIFQRMQNLPNTLVRIIPYDNDENLEKLMTSVHDEIIETQAKILLVQHSSYKGETLYDKTQSLASANEIEYFVRKLRCMTTVASVFISASKSAQIVPTVLLDYESSYKNTFDYILLKGINQFLRNARTNSEFKVKTLIN